MSIILIDARHYGAQLRRARKMLNINRATAGKILRVSARELRKYELGTHPIPPDLMCNLLHRGLALSLCRTYNAENNPRK